MTTAGEGSAPTALDLLFGPDTDAAEAVADEILSSGDPSLARPWRSSPRRSGRLPCRKRRPPRPPC